MSAPKARVASWVERRSPAGWGTRLDDRDADTIAAVYRRLDPLFREDGPFPVEVTGLDAAPAAPVLVVSTHSGGVLFPDAWGLGYAWVRHFGPERALHGLGHEMLFAVPGLGPTMAKLGAVRADRKNALRALLEWRRDVCVMPGGDRDVFRPATARHRVDFHGRSGYAELAIRAGVPVLPVVHTGPHDTLVVLTDGARIARRLRLPALFRAEVFPISLTVPWGLTIGPWPNIPVPTRFRYRFGPAIVPPPHGDPERPPERATVAAFDAHVRGEMQSTLDALASETPSLRQRLRSGLRA